ncbi:hypothetical protein P4O66_017418, partial [Electrophorus voltai]
KAQIVSVYRISRLSLSSVSSAESLPRLSVVDVSDWAGRTEHPERRLLCKTVGSRRSVPEGSAYNFPWSPLRPQKEKFKSAGPALPVPSSVGPTAHTSGTKDKGLNTAQIGPLIGCESPWGLGSLVLWVPNPRRIPESLTLKRAKSPHCAVKEIICLPACLPQKTPKVSGKSEGVKKSVRFQLPLTSRPRRQARFASLDQSAALEAQLDSATVSSGSDEEEAGIITGPSHPPTECGAPRESSSFLLRNTPVVLHCGQERAAKRASKVAPASLYKLDSKTGKEHVDWENLKGQAYLWKRHNVPQQKECRDRFCPPGAAKTLETPGLCTASKVSFQPPLRSQASGAWYCMKGIWHYQQECQPSTAAETHTLPTMFDTTMEAEHSLLHKVLDTGEKSERQKGSKDSVTPFNSALYCRCPAQAQHDGECEGPVVQAALAFTGEAVPCSCAGPAHSLSLLSGPLEPWRGLSSTDRGPEHKDHWLPPPSIRSL